MARWRVRTSYRIPADHVFSSRMAVEHACGIHGYLRAAQLETEIAHAAVVAGLVYPGAWVWMRSATRHQDHKGTHRDRSTHFERSSPIGDIATDAAHISAGESVVSIPARWSGDTPPRRWERRVLEILSPLVPDARQRERMEHGHHSSALVPSLLNQRGPDRRMEEYVRNSFGHLFLGLPRFKTGSSDEIQEGLEAFVRDTSRGVLQACAAIARSEVQRGIAEGSSELAIVSEGFLAGLLDYSPDGGAISDLVDGGVDLAELRAEA